MSNWISEQPTPSSRLGIIGFLRVTFRFILMVIVIYGMLLVFWIARLFEFPFGRPISPRVTQVVCYSCLYILGIKIVVAGSPMRGFGAVVSNHSSWLDIFALNAPQRVFFVSKSEVGKWFGIGILAVSTKTVFIERKLRFARKQKDILASRLANGDRLLFFPEGTSTDGQRVLPFNSTLFSAFFEEEIHRSMYIQPVSVAYTSPSGEDPRYYNWWGKFDLAPHLLKVLGSKGGGRVRVTFHSPVKASDFADRKVLAKKCEDIVRCGFENKLVPDN